MSASPRAAGSGLGTRIVAALEEAGAGVGCHYYVEKQYGLSAALLDRLDAVKLIRASPPACRDHACPLVGQCEYERLFSTKEPGRSNKKFKLSMFGAQMIEEPRALAEALGRTYVARVVLQALADRAHSALSLNTILMKCSVEELRATGKVEATFFSRAELRDALRLLVESGLVQVDEARYSLTSVESTSHPTG